MRKFSKPLFSIKKYNQKLVKVCLIFNFRTGLTFGELLPEDRTQYDKMRPPKKDGAPTIVYFHVTVMGLDSIDETSMVRFRFVFFFI